MRLGEYLPTSYWKARFRSTIQDNKNTYQKAVMQRDAVAADGMVGQLLVGRKV
jgi:hypothetical protein